MEGRGERQTFGKEHGRTVDEVRTKGVEELMMDNWVKSYYWIGRLTRTEMWQECRKPCHLVFLKRELLVSSSFLRCYNSRGVSPVTTAVAALPQTVYYSV